MKSSRCRTPISLIYQAMILEMYLVKGFNLLNLMPQTKATRCIVHYKRTHCISVEMHQGGKCVLNVLKP